MNELTMRRKPIPIQRESKPNMGRRPTMATMVNGSAETATQTATAMAITEITEMMTACDDFDAMLAQALHRDDLPPAALHHLAECPECAAALSDYEAIAESVRQLPPLEEPVPDLWPQIREALRREGVIHADGRECAPAPKLVK